MRPRAALLWCLGLLACTHAKRQPAAPNARLEAEGKPTQPAARSAAEAESAHDGFLLENAAGQLVLRSARSGAEQVLASVAQHSLYDERLELIWYEDGERLWVLDLRKLETTPVLIAEHVPEHAEFHVAREADRLLEPADGCDSVPILRLNWSAKPGFEGWYANAPALAAEGRAWLVAELGRTARQLPLAQAFSETHTERAWKGDRSQCAEPFVCGSSLSFGVGVRQLLLVSAHQGDDCWHFECVLRDGQSDAFGTPPDARRWGAASTAQPGSCGPYRFNRDGSALLVDERMCVTGGSCQALGGMALGWREPGVTLGAPE
jgi:hypothetical protein